MTLNAKNTVQLVAICCCLSSSLFVIVIRSHESANSMNIYHILVDCTVMCCTNDHQHVAVTYCSCLLMLCNFVSSCKIGKESKILTVL